MSLKKIRSIVVHNCYYGKDIWKEDEKKLDCVDIFIICEPWIIQVF